MISHFLSDSASGLPFNLVYYHNFLEDTWHTFDRLTVAYVMSGSSVLYYNGEDIPLHAGSMVIINADTPRRYTQNDGLSLLCIHFQMSYYYNLFPELRSKSFHFSRAKTPEDRYNLRGLFMHVMKEIEAKPSGYLLGISAICTQIILLLSKSFSYENPARAKSSAEKSEQMVRLVEYINNNYEKSWTLPELASYMNLSPNYLCRLFKEQMGMPITKYINQVRIHKSLGDVMEGKLSIAEIAGRHGFQNINSYYKCFKDSFHQTPVSYKKSQESADEESMFLLPARPQDSMLKWLLAAPQTKREMEQAVGGGRILIEADCAGEGKPYHKNWNTSCAFATPACSMTTLWQKQIQKVQMNFPFEYMRCPGVYIINPQALLDGTDRLPEFNIRGLEQMIDLLLSLKLKPIIEFGYIEDRQFSSDTLEEQIEALSSPKAVQKWCEGVRGLINRLIDRYSLEEVLGWRFCIWGTPNLAPLWKKNPAWFASLFCETYRTIKAVDKRFFVGGAKFNWNLVRHGWLETFFRNIVREGVDPDFLSFRISLHTAETKIKSGCSQQYDYFLQYLSHQAQGEADAVIGDEDHLLRSVYEIRALIDRYGLTGKLMIAKFCSTEFQDDLTHDTCFMSAFIVKNILDLCDEVDEITYSSLIDIPEKRDNSRPFSGGLGLVSEDGIQKSSYYAFHLLAKLGPELLARGNGYFVTRRSHRSIQIVLYNYIHFNHDYRRMLPEMLAKSPGNQIFENDNYKDFSIRLTNLHGSFTVKTYRINSFSSSAYDEWLRMGSPSPCYWEEIECLKGKSIVEYHVHRFKADGVYEKDIHLVPHEVVLMDIYRD